MEQRSWDLQLGTLAASWTELTKLREEIQQVRSAVSAPFCVNLVLAFDQRKRLELVLGQGVEVVSFSWGVDAALVGRTRDAGASVLVQVGDIHEAKAAATAGATALIAQGVEAGGHVQATTSLLELVRALRTEVSLPIIAAGGIADGASARRAIKAGAQAVACGTAFLAASEANVHPAYRARVLAAEASDTHLTTLFDVGWPNAPHRVIRNRTHSDWTNAERPMPGKRPGEGDVIGRRNGDPIARYSDAQPTRQTEGDIDAMAMYAGTSVDYVSGVAPAKSITADLAGALR